MSFARAHTFTSYTKIKAADHNDNWGGLETYLNSLPIFSGAIPDNTIYTNQSDATKIFKFDQSGETTGKTLTIAVVNTLDRTLTLPNATDTLVGKATTDTLTNKTLTAPVISSIVNTGTLTLPTSTDTLVGRATTDTFTNKTYDAAGTGNALSNVSNSSISASAAIARSKLLLNYSTTAVNGTYTALITDDLITCSATGSFTITLPAAAGAVGHVFNFKRTDASAQFTVTIDANGSETIDGNLTVSMITQNEEWCIQSNATGWIVLSHYAETPWTAYSPTVNAGTTAPTKGTISHDRSYWRRQGDSIQIRWSYYQTAAGADGNGQYLIPIPFTSAWTISSTCDFNSNLDVASNVGTFSGYNSNINLSAGGWVFTQSNIYLSCVLQENGSNPVAIGSGHYPFGATTLSFNMFATVPITTFFA